ncbi:MAG: DNA-directed RNA polymerase subunit beta, partial [Candidatus Paceibacterota bacterium]
MKQKFFSRYTKPLADYPNFVETQLESWQWFLDEGLKELFEEFSPIDDYSGKKFSFEFVDFEFGEAKYDEHYAREYQLSYDVPLRATVKLTNKQEETSKEQEMFMADFPMMTSHGTFIINGIERVLIPQLIRSFGVLFIEGESRGQRRFGAKVIPERGVWMEFESDYANVLWVRIDRKRKFPVTVLLSVLSGKVGEDLIGLFKGNELAQEYITNTLEKDDVTRVEEAYVEMYKKLREGDIVSFSNAKEYIDSIFTEERYDLSRVGRFRFNQRFDKPTNDKTLDNQVITLDDLVLTLGHIATLNNDPHSEADDIDHL